MKKTTQLRKFLKPVAGLIGLVIVVIFSGGFLARKVSPGKLDVQPGLPLPPATDTVLIQTETSPVRVEVVGTTASEEKINLSARIPAYVGSVFASAGDRVKKDQVLIALDDRDIRQKLAAAEAQLHQARTEYERAKQLFEREATTQQALTAAESMFNAAKAQVEEVKVMLTYAQVKSPIDGVVTDRRVEAGDLANPGMLLLAVYDPLRMRLEAPVPVRLVPRLAIGQAVDIQLERPERPLTGTVSEIVSEVDSSSRTQLVKVHLDNAEGDVLPGTFGRLWVAAESRETLFVPASAVVQIGQLTFVQVAQDGRALRRLVKTGPSQNGRVEILSGLSAGESVVIHPIREN